MAFSKIWTDTGSLAAGSSSVNLIGCGKTATCSTTNSGSRVVTTDAPICLLVNGAVLRVVICMVVGTLDVVLNIYKKKTCINFVSFTKKIKKESLAYQPGAASYFFINIMVDPYQISVNLIETVGVRSLLSTCSTTKWSTGIQSCACA